MIITETSKLPQKNISHSFIKPYHTWVEISKTAIDHNINYYKNKIGMHNHLALVIKGNGYGHGLQTMGKICQDNPHVDYLCVAQLSEALTLTKAGITKPILILGYPDNDSALAAHTSIEFMVDNIDYARQLNLAGSLLNHVYKIHIKIDTGLSRMGIHHRAALPFITTIQSLPFVKIQGIYSHFAASDTNPTFTAQQLTIFNTLIKSLQNNNIHIPLIHMSNTASLNTIIYPSLYNFFRTGLGLYGLDPHNKYLKPALTWKTYISSIKTVEKGSYIGYANSYITNRTTRIALLPIGYSDGYQFRFSNKTNVLINNQIAPIIGRIAMNITIIDITDIHANIHDEVTLMGDHEGITIHNLAQAAGIINVREILTSINPLAPRIITE